MKIIYSPEFVRRYQNLPESVRNKAKKQETIFRENPFDPRLKTHKLKGRLSEFWAFSVDFNYRVIFKFEGKDVIRFYTIGGHSIYF